MSIEAAASEHSEALGELTRHEMLYHELQEVTGWTYDIRFSPSFHDYCVTVDREAAALERLRRAERMRQ